MVSATVLTACLLSLATAGQPSISAPTEVKVSPGDLGAVRITWTGDDFKYTVSPGLNSFREYDPDKQVLALRVMAQKAGAYTITCVAAGGGKLTDFVTISVKVGTAPQPPPVDPDPPAPVPHQGKLYVVVIEDGNTPRAPAVARVLTDKGLWDEVERLGHVWRVIPTSDPICTRNGYCTLATAAGTPCLILLTPEGKALNARKLPLDSPGVLNAIKEYAR